MVEQILFEVPTKFASGIADGSIVRIGTLLKDSMSGQILSHVQETGLAQKLLSNASLLPFSPLSALDLASSGYANVQLHQLKTMVEGLQMLQYANIGLAATGLGVSVLGFMLINQKLKGLESAIAQLSTQMDKHFQELAEKHLRHKFANIYVLFERAEQASFLRSPAQEWLTIEGQLAMESGFLRSEIGHHLTQNSFHYDWFNKMTSALAMCNAARIQCLLQANEMSAAQHASTVIADNYSDLFDPLSATQLAAKMTEAEQDSREDDLHLFKSNQAKAAQVMLGLREMTDAAMTQPLLLEHLGSREISGQAYLNAVNAQDQHPIILLTP